MKSCFHCNGRKMKFDRDNELRITVRCEKCGAEVKTPCFTVDSAKGYWNMKQHAFEHQAKKEEQGETAS